eukprot:CAMPEP_0203744326 /NCGR_PEP_ID=MMETSP0098-20131031/440_1 /ASSEMBLY_ACC=CAM_ASM_000208 /TAXON_ID=96639 /ORGANISM=" , Strain NY0313808BC1" /LENGTH=579 /DNA_ID=CAMNT_0050631823 /DNA_START=557 /DNA_END=2296 /DNA_ORIENTATION=-
MHHTQLRSLDIPIQLETVDNSDIPGPIWPEVSDITQEWLTCAVVERKAPLELVKWLDEPFVHRANVLKTWSASSQGRIHNYSLIQSEGLSDRVRQFEAATTGSEIDVLRYGDKEPFAQFGGKILTKKQTKTVFIGGSNSEGRTKFGFVELFKKLLNSLYPLEEGSHVVVNLGKGGYTSCVAAKQFRTELESSLHHADLVVVEFFLNDEPEDAQKCFESLLLRIRQVVPCALVIDLALPPAITAKYQMDSKQRTHVVHDRIIDAHPLVISTVRMAPLVLNGPASTIPENPGFQKKYLFEKFMKDKVHLGDFGVMFTTLALGVMTIHAQRVAQDYRSHVVKGEPQELLSKPVSEFDVNRGIEFFTPNQDLFGINIPITPRLYETCSPENSSPSCSREIFKTWNLWKSKLPCDDCGREKNKNKRQQGPRRNVQETDGGWVYCVSPLKQTCRRPSVQFDYCATERSGLLHFTMTVKQRKVDPINMFRISLHAVNSYENFGEAQIIAWIGSDQRPAVPLTFSSVYLNALWERQASIPFENILEPPLMFPSDQEEVELNMIVVPVNWANRTRCKLQILSIQLEYQ